MRICLPQSVSNFCSRRTSYSVIFFLYIESKAAVAALLESENLEKTEQKESENSERNQSENLEQKEFENSEQTNSVKLHHTSLYEGKSSEKFSCEICGKFYKNNQTLKSHKSRDHYSMKISEEISEESENISKFPSKRGRPSGKTYEKFEYHGIGVKVLEDGDKRSQEEIEQLGMMN